MADVEVSVVIPVYNASATLPRVLDALRAVKTAETEIILVDDGSTDGSVELIRRAGFDVIPGSHRGPSAARNLGLQVAKGRFVAFTDSDCIVPKNWPADLVSALEQTDATGAGGGQRSPDDETRLGRRFHAALEAVGFAGDYLHSGRGIRWVSHNPSCNSIYRKEALEEANGFREGLFPGEDVDLDHRLAKRGHRFVFVPGVEVAHYRPGTYVGCASMMKRYGWTQAALRRLHGPFRPLHRLPFFSIPLALLVGITGLTFPAATAGMLALAGLTGYTALGLRQRAWPRPDLLLLILVCWHWGFIVGWLRGRNGVADLGHD